MPPVDIARARLHNQRLSAPRFTSPADVVSWFGAVQAQEYPGAKWALALRMRRPTGAAIEEAFAGGAILRTHVMRPTWHFVAPADIRWMLELTGPRVRQATAYYSRNYGIDAAVIKRSNKAIASALEGGVRLTRHELAAVLNKSGVPTVSGQRLAGLMMSAELDGVICSGPIRGKQFTYALLDERVPPAARTLSQDDALAELTRRYFTSHGPAQMRDFVWWSGLRVREARAGLEMVQDDLATDVIGGRTYWWAPGRRPALPRTRAAWLLPLYDEFLIAYKDRSDAFDPRGWKRAARPDAFSAAIVLDGRVIGMWRRTIRRQTAAVRCRLGVAVTRSDKALIVEAAERYGRFLGLDVSTEW